MDRTDVLFPSGTEQCAAWLYRPSGAGPHACVVLAHGFGGIREARLDAFAERFAAAGLVALVFDYRNFGASSGEPRQLLDIRRQHEDWRAAIAYARSLPDVDPERIALWGTSFSGGHVVTVAAQDARIAAVVAQAPFMDGLAVLRAIGPAHDLRLAVAGARDEWRRLRHREPYRIAIVGPPGSRAVMTSPDAEPGYLALIPEGVAFANAVAARIGLRVGVYRPVRAAARVRCPLLVCICDRDVVTPPGPAATAAARAPLGEARHYDAGHFEIYVGELFERAVADQVEFLTRCLRPGASVAPSAVSASPR